MNHHSKHTNIDKSLEDLVNCFDTPEGSTKYLRPIERVLQYCLTGMDLTEKDLVSFSPNDSIRNYLDSNDIPFREVDTPVDLYTQEHPPLIFEGNEVDDVYCLLPGQKKFTVYSGKTNGLVYGVTPSQLSDQCFEIFSYLPDQDNTLLTLIPFALFGQLWPIARVTALSCLSVVLFMLLPLFTDPLVTYIIPSREVEILIQCTFGFLLILGVGAVSTYLQNIILIRIETISDIRLQTALWDRLVKLPMPFIGSFSTADLNSRVDAVTKIRQVLSSTIIQATIAGVFSLIYIFLMFLLTPILAALLSICLIGLAIALTILLYLDFKIQLPIYEQEAALSNFSLEMLNAIVPLRVALGEERVLRQWITRVQDVATLYMRSKLYSDTTVVITSTFANITIAIVIVFVFVYSLFVPTAALEQGLSSLTGRFLSTLVAYKALISSVSKLVNIAGTSFSQVYVQWKRAKPVFAAPVDFGYSLSARRVKLTKGIELKDVSYAYPSSSYPVFNDVNMYFEVGKYTAITGESGCGKSTLLRIILGLDQPTTGQVLVDGISLPEINIRSLRRDIGVVPQEISLFSGSLKKNICSGLDYSDEEIWQVLELAEMADQVSQMPMKLETVITGGGSSLSGGERQRLTIARALISNPKLLIFDEATSALDPEQQSKIIDNITSSGTSLIAVAHRLSTISRADKLYELKRSS